MYFGKEDYGVLNVFFPVYFGRIFFSSTSFVTNFGRYTCLVFYHDQCIQLSKMVVDLYRRDALLLVGKAS